MAVIDDILVNGEAVDKAALRSYLHSREVASPADFGAIAGGVVDCAPAFAAAFAVADTVLVPLGVWRIASTIVVPRGKALIGFGEGSVLQARETPLDPNALPVYPSRFNAIELREGYARLRDFTVVGGETAVKLYGRDGPCVRNVITGLTLWDATIGIVLDGYDNPDWPCYWNHLGQLAILRPQIDGVLLTTESTGDTPNANKFHDVRVYSMGAPMSGRGFFVSTGRYNNSFFDCEANVHPSAEACFRLGALADGNLLVNFYAESTGAVPGVRLDNGAINTSIINLFSATGGAPIWDTTGARRYLAFNAGHPAKVLLHRAVATDLTIEGLTVNTTYVELSGGGLYQPDLTLCHTFLVSAWGGATEFRLPSAAQAIGRKVVIKKTDLSNHPVTVTEAGGIGPDNRPVVLANRYDWVEAVSNGANWWVLSAAPATVPLNTQYVEGQSLVQPDLTRQLYLVSAYTGPVEVRLPAASVAAGRQTTIKKSDPGGFAVSVTVTGGAQVDSHAVTLGGPGAYITVISDGGYWYEVAGRY